MLKIQLPDKDVIEVKKGQIVLEIAKTIDLALAKVAIVAEINGTLVDLNHKINEDCSLRIFSEHSTKALEVLNHSTAHVMAAAVIKLFPNVKPTIGPAIKPVGFYYDFDIPKFFSREDLIQIELEMRKIVQADKPFIRQEILREKAIEYYEEKCNDFKKELLQDIEDAIVSFYSIGSEGFTDLCRGPHVPSTGRIRAFKLLNVSSVFWRGNPARESLQRINGVAFFNRKELNKHLQVLEEARKRDHRILGPQLDLFDMAGEYGPGMPLYFPKGTILWDVLENFWRKEHLKAGYQIIRTPHLFKEHVWKISGHLEHYQENMYPVDVRGERWFVKPMNCPGHMMIYKRRIYSHRDLPIRLAEYGTVHRYEMSGALHGLLRVRGFTQDDAHIFMLPDQLEDEIMNIIKMVDHFYSVFGFEEWVYNVSTKPEKYMGSDEIWEHATNILIKALNRSNKEYLIKEGDGAFYGPKIDVDVKDAIGRMWQLATIQVDFNLPERFEITYMGEDGKKHHPVVIHRVIYGAVDRFIAILLEHYAGKFPIWMSPLQAIVIPITDRNIERALDVRNKLVEAGIRASADLSSERMEYKIREAQLQKIPFMISVGDKEIRDKSIAVRSFDGNVEYGVKLDTFIVKVLQKIKRYE